MKVDGTKMAKMVESAGMVIKVSRSHTSQR